MSGSILNNCDYKNPNELEWKMYLHNNFYKEKTPLLISYDKSACFCNPINKVQSFNNNRSGDISSEYLLGLFEKGVRANYTYFKKFNNISAHQLVHIFQFMDIDS